MEGRQRLALMAVVSHQVLGCADLLVLCELQGREAQHAMHDEAVLHGDGWKDFAPALESLLDRST